MTFIDAGCQRARPTVGAQGGDLRPLVQPAADRGDGPRVDTSREQDPCGASASTPVADRLHQQPGQRFRGLCLVGHAGAAVGVGFPECGPGHLAGGVDDDHLARSHLLDSDEEGSVQGHPPFEHVLPQQRHVRFGPDFGNGEDLCHLGCDPKTSRGRHVEEEWAHPQRISGQDDPPTRSVPDDEREVAQDPGCQTGTPASVRGHDHRTVADLRRDPQPPDDLGAVVETTVDDRDDIGILDPDRTQAGHHAAVVEPSETGAAAGPPAAPGWTTVRNHIEHRVEVGATNGRVVEGDDATHRRH